VAYAAPVRFLGLHTACIGSSVGRRNTTKVFGDSRDTFRPWIFYGIGYAPWVGSLVAAMATWGNKDAVYAFYGLRVVADALWGTACAMSIIEVEKGNKRLAKATVLTRPILDLKGRIGVSILIKM